MQKRSRPFSLHTIALKRCTIRDLPSHARACDCGATDERLRRHDEHSGARGEREALAFTARLALFTRATSLGGTESLIEHRASVEGAAVTLAPPNLLRVSIGLEHPDDLIADLEQALAG